MVTIAGSSELSEKLNNSLYNTEFNGYDFSYNQENTKILAVYKAYMEELLFVSKLSFWAYKWIYTG